MILELDPIPHLINNIVFTDNSINYYPNIQNNKGFSSRDINNVQWTVPNSFNNNQFDYDQMFFSQSNYQN